MCDLSFGKRFGDSSGLPNSCIHFASYRRNPMALCPVREGVKSDQLGDHSRTAIMLSVAGYRMHIRPSRTIEAGVAATPQRMSLLVCLQPRA